MSSDTPLTDRITVGCIYGPHVSGLAEHARNLERQNSKIRELLRQAIKPMPEYNYGVWLKNSRELLAQEPGKQTKEEAV